jgi:hypothetical protein
LKKGEAHGEGDFAIDETEDVDSRGGVRETLDNEEVSVVSVDVNWREEGDGDARDGDEEDK